MSGAARRIGVLSLALLALGVGAVQAQPVDCTGISDVSIFDGPTVGDMDGQLSTVLVANGFTRPLFVTSPPGDIERLFVVEQDGRIRIIKNGAVLGTPFLDINGIVRSPVDGGNNEEGLLGLAFHPDYATNGYFFVYYNNTSGNIQVSRYTRDSVNPDLANSGSAASVIAISHPSFGNHNGGMLAFRASDGYLYIGTGDGGSGCDPSGNAQSLNSNLGKLLRLQVDSLPYSTAGNPFDGAVPGNNEIWSYGLRNPWRFSFDRVSDALFIGDVGQNAREEINCVKASSAGAENYGWDHFEGSACPNPSCGSQGSCAIAIEGPVYESIGSPRSITGGYSYRGCRMSDLHGTYFFADYLTSTITSFRTDGSCGLFPAITRTSDLAPGGGLSISQITSFGEDARGEIYIIDRAGEVFRIVPALAIMQVSGEGAPGFTHEAGGDWSWEDLRATSGHTISSYRVYRSESGPAGPFTCAHSTSAPAWIGGDPGTPAADEAWYYLITARNAVGEETRPGYDSDGVLRTVDTASVCPP